MECCSIIPYYTAWEDQRENLCYNIDVAHLAVLQLPWCATTSHWNVVQLLIGISVATGSGQSAYLGQMGHFFSGSCGLAGQP